MGWRSSPGGARPRRVAAATTLAVVVLSFGYVLWVEVVLRNRGRGDLLQANAVGASFVAASVASAVVGAVLLVRRPAHPVGWSFAGLAVSIAVPVEAHALLGLSETDPSRSHELAAVAADAAFVPWLVALGLVCALTPDGWPEAHRARGAVTALLAAGTTWCVLRFVSTEPLTVPFDTIENPWAVPSGALDMVRLAAALVTMGLLAWAVVALVWRFRRAEGDRRRQLLWVAVGAIPIPPLVAISFVASRIDNDELLAASAAASVAFLPVGAGLAVLRYRLYDVERILSRAVTYALVSLLLAATYGAVVFVVAGLVSDAAGRSPATATVATLVAVGAAGPVYASVREVIDRRLRRRHHEAVQHVSRHIADPGEGRTIEAVLRDALDDPKLVVAFWDPARSDWVRGDGRPTEPSADTRLVERGGRTVASVATIADPTTVGDVIAAAAPELENAALRAAIAAQLEEVRASRERLARAQVDERRRVERDLHDGAQQRLLGVAAHMQAALLNGDPDRLRSALEHGVCEARTTVAELRSLANGLHPSVLEHGGLPAALHELAARHAVDLEVLGPTRRHPPVIEATLWFVACEAIVNTAKHANATTVSIRLEDRGETLHLVVGDDGSGGADPHGGGLRGLRDRIGAAGGTLTVNSPPGVGTTIEAAVPCGS